VRSLDDVFVFCGRVISSSTFSAICNLQVPAKPYASDSKNTVENTGNKAHGAHVRMLNDLSNSVEYCNPVLRYESGLDAKRLEVSIFFVSMNLEKVICEGILRQLICSNV
jgi:hypothetical protein